MMMQYKILTEQDGHILNVKKMMEQVEKDFPEGIPAGTRIAFEGDPFRNDNTNVLLVHLAEYHVHPVISTVLPQRIGAAIYLSSLVNMMNANYKAGEITLRFVLGSTSESVRETMFGPVVSLRALSKSFRDHLPEVQTGKVILSFDPFTTVKVATIRKYFPPEEFAVELRVVDKVIEPTLFNNPNLEEEIREAGYELLANDVEEEVCYNEGKASTDTGRSEAYPVGA